MAKSTKKTGGSKSSSAKKAAPKPAAKKPATPAPKKPAPKAAAKAPAAKPAPVKAAQAPAKSAPAKLAVVAKPTLPAKAARSTPGSVPAGSSGKRINGRLERHSTPLPPPPFAAGEVVLSDGKPKKNQAGLSMRELEHFRDLLLAKRRELVGDMSSMEREALRSTSGSNLSNLPIHMADMGTDNYEQEFTLGLVQKDRDILREINLALAKIQSGSYGICEGTGKPIGKPRLEAKPWARHGIEYARKLETHGIRR